MTSLRKKTPLDTAIEAQRHRRDALAETIEQTRLAYSEAADALDRLERIRDEAKKARQVKVDRRKAKSAPPTQAPHPSKA